MINKIIRNFVAKQMAGRSDDGIMITLKDPQRVTLGENIMADLLMRNGIDPTAITSEEQLKLILRQIENAQASAIRNTGIRDTQSAKIFEITTGKEIPKGSKIMGGQAVDDMPPPGSRGGPEDIAAPVQSSEETLKNMIMAENKKNIDKMKIRKKFVDQSIDNVSPGFSGDRKIDAELVAEDLATRMGKVYDDLPIKERLDLYDQAYQGLSKKKFKMSDTQKQFNKDVEEAGGMEEFLNKNPIDDDSGDFATGGRVGLKVGSGIKFLRKVFGKQGFDEMKTRDPEMYVGLLEIVDMYRKRDKEGLKMYLQKFLPHMDDAQIEDFIRGSDGSEGLIGELIRLGSGRDYAGKIDMMKRAQEMRKLDNLEVTDDMKRKPNAEGGIMRLGLKEGSGMSRRTFLKILGGAMSIPIIGKIFKPFKIGKKVTQVPIIKTDNVAGKPEWFDQLVNKVILEGDDVTKRFATVDREVVHMKKIDDNNTVTVYQDLDAGTVRVEYDSPANTFEDTVQLQYKKPKPDEGDPNPSAEFDVAESGPVGRVDGPDDFSLDVDEVGGTSIKDLDSDVSKLKEYATGEKPTIKELVQNMKRKDKAKRITEDPEAQSDAIIKRQGDYDGPYEDFASGGIARMLGE
tara:strand:- start:1290 stop:3170 length:1881 start_codon:yes stop_codon:yes gene_type:complete